MPLPTKIIEIPFDHSNLNLTKLIKKLQITMTQFTKFPKTKIYLELQKTKYTTPNTA